MKENAPRLYLSVITIAEGEDVIAKARRQGATGRLNGSSTGAESNAPTSTLLAFCQWTSRWLGTRRAVPIRRELWVSRLDRPTLRSPRQPRAGASSF